MSARFVIFGSGGFGRELILPAQQMLAAADASKEVVFASDGGGPPVGGRPHIRAEEIADEDEVVIAVGDSGIRRDISARVGGRAGKLIAPSAVIGPDVELAEGAVLCGYTMVTASARIGRQFQCNIYSYVAHDCVIGDFVTFAPRVCCNGNVHIHDGAYIGTGAVLKQGTAGAPLVIGEGAVVGMGAVVTRSVPPGAVVIGNPAKPLARA
jgi:sugar O-acyltransferase (sialic acid O-acetyltransferase NeuD family)